MASSKPKSRVVRALFALGIAAALPVAIANAWILGSGLQHRSSAMEATSTVAIVPGSTASKQGRPLMILRDRLRAALDLYETKRVRAILISGVDAPDDPEVAAMNGWLIAKGVPTSDILVDRGGFRTRETMLRAARLFQIKSAVVCTQNLNMPRSLFLARHAGIDADGVALATPMATSPRWLATEALKNTLAFVEAYLPTGTTPHSPVAHR